MKEKESLFLKQLYEKSEIWFAVGWIVAYCMFMSIGDSLSESVGVEKVLTLPIAIILSTVLFFFLKKNGLLLKYGLCKAEVPATKMWYYIPVVLLLTANLWYGVSFNLEPLETMFYILTMFCVGFLEEMIFRGLLFQAMLKDDVKSAIIASSVTFGLGHIINLFNGSGAQLLPNILQVIYATAAGFMFVMIYYRSKSLVVCIITHGLFNALSVFSNEVNLTDQKRIISCVLLAVISGTYAIYLALALKEVKTKF